jgi:hypothetical protein
MKKTFCKTFFFFAAFLLAGCTSLQKEPKEWPNAITEPPNATYEKDVLPVIIEQINETAATFFYDMEKYKKIQRSNGVPVDKDKPPPRNVVVGNKEIGGVCADYASHFIDNYKGLGEVFYLGVDVNGETFLQRRVKPFERKDIKIQQENYQAKRDYINNFYNRIIQKNKNNKEFTNWGTVAIEEKGWVIEPLNFHTNKDGKLFLIENTPISTPEFHAGETEKEDFFNHAWVRIIWRGRTFDVEPTWYDNGLPLEWAIEEIIPNKINSYNDSRVEIAREPLERNNPLKSDAELIATAIRRGDCAFLYNYTQRKDADRQLLAQANDAIIKYTYTDNRTANYKTNKMEAQIRRISKENLENLFIEPETVLPKVVSSLMSGISDQFLKAKILHDWICDNIAFDTEMYFSDQITAQDYISVLKKKKAVGSGYTELYNRMCILAGIEAIGINGYSKVIGYSGELDKDTNHAWNAVYLGNKWYLVDVTWDAGIIERNTFIKQYSTAWLFIESSAFLYSHLPEEDAYQYYAPVLTADDFIREAYIPGKFFQYGFSPNGEYPEYDNFIDGGFAFDLVLENNNVQYLSELRTTQQRNINGATWTERNGATITFNFDVPDTDQYKGHIFACYSDEEKPKYRVDIKTYEKEWVPKAEALYNTPASQNKKITEQEFEFFKNSYYKVADNDSYYLLEDQFDIQRNAAVLKIHKLLDISTTSWEHILSFNIKAVPRYRGFENGVLKYPYAYSNYTQLSNTQLISPMTGTLKSGSSQTFVISSKDYSEFFIIINGKWNNFKKNNRTGNYEMILTVPKNIDTIEIYGVNSRRESKALIRYKVVK